MIRFNVGKQIHYTSKIPEYNHNNVYVLPHTNIECQPALGMESGAISDAQISASTQYDSEHGPKNARLRNTQGKGSWVAGLNDVNQWLQVDLAGLKIVTGIATQGRHSEHEMWVTKYKLQYSNDAASFQVYKQQGQNVDKVQIYV